MMTPVREREIEALGILGFLGSSRQIVSRIYIRELLSQYLDEDEENEDVDRSMVKTTNE